ncbi:MAG: hypothetical protein CSA29_03435 [Desulfobacterales bacterium]|nr:MAG: hypothetical protein CSA29_03435 [Desulfobacterales bacterium]
MTEQADRFANIELARLYESQGYSADAISMYRTLIEANDSADVVAEAHEALARLEGSDEIVASHAQLKTDKYGENESRVARLLEKWLTLMVIRKRVNVYRSIWERR